MKKFFKIYFIDKSYIEYNLIKKTFVFKGKIGQMFLLYKIKMKLSDKELLRFIFLINKIKGGITNKVLEIE